MLKNSFYLKTFLPPSNFGFEKQLVNSIVTAGWKSDWMEYKLGDVIKCVRCCSDGPLTK